MIYSVNMPTLVYDGNCGFCKFWVEELKALTAGAVNYIPYQELAPWRGFSVDDCKRSIKFYEPKSNKTYEAAEAAFMALSYHGSAASRLPLELYRKLPGFKSLSEFIYMLVARSRPLLSRLGSEFQYSRSANIFIGGIGLLYFLAFLSLAFQVEGLWGPRGIMPIPWSAIGFDWVTNENAVAIMLGACGLGMLAGLTVFVKKTLFTVAINDAAPEMRDGSSKAAINIWTSAALLIAFSLYYFFVSFGSPFMSFQWDILLLEAGFLASLLSFFIERYFLIATKLMYFLLVFLLFKLMLLSGLVKLASGDSSWLNLTALDYHYQTQPIPNPLSYLVHQLPSGFDKFSTLVMFIIELLLPLFIFIPGTFSAYLRYIAAFGFIVLQLLIIATGNYCFFNLLTILLALLLLDDGFYSVAIRTFRKVSNPQSCSMIATQRFKPASILLTPLALVFAFLISYTNLIFITRPMATLTRTKPLIDIKPDNLIFPAINVIFRNHLCNPYGLFAVMTTERREIIIQGSNDGQRWLDYEFKYKPGDLYRMPPQIAPMQPRLDWQMWFASLSNWQQNIWFVNLCMRLLEGDTAVTKLLAYNPYAAKAPRFIRAISYRYEFTNIGDPDGAYWKRSEPRLYLPVISLRH